MSFPGLDLGAYLRESEVLDEKQISSTNVDQDQISSTNSLKENSEEEVTNKENRRRLRNVLSSRNYRMKKRNQMKKLEEDNTELKRQIHEAEDQLQRLNSAFRLLSSMLNTAKYAVI